MATANPKTAQLYKDLVARVAKLIAAAKAVQPRLDGFVRELKRAVADMDAPTIRLQMKAVAVEANGLKGLIAQAKDALGVLATIEEDDAFVVAENRKLTVLSKQLQAIEDTLADELDTAVGALDEGKQGLAGAAHSSTDLRERLTELDTLAGKARDAIAAIAKVADVHLKTTGTAARDRDREGFKKALAAAEAQLANAQRLHQTFAKGHDARVAGLVKIHGKDAVADPQGKSALACAAAAAALVGRIESAIRETAKDVPPPIDFAKAAKVLGLDKDVARVKKALDGTAGDIRDQLQAMSRSLGLPKSGKDLFDQLQRACVL